MKRVSLALAIALIAVPALAQGMGERTGFNALVEKAPSTAEIAAITAMFEIES